MDDANRLAKIPRLTVDSCIGRNPPDYNDYNDTSHLDPGLFYSGRIHRPAAAQTWKLTFGRSTNEVPFVEQTPEHMHSTSSTRSGKLLAVPPCLRLPGKKGLWGLYRQCCSVIAGVGAGHGCLPHADTWAKCRVMKEQGHLLL